MPEKGNIDIFKNYIKKIQGKNEKKFEAGQDNMVVYISIKGS